MLSLRRILYIGDSHVCPSCRLWAIKKELASMLYVDRYVVEIFEFRNVFNRYRKFDIREI